MSTESVARRFNALLPHLTERQRRLWLATEARELGTGGVAKVARTVGVAPSTVRRGLAELDHAEPPPVRVSRKPGGGRKRAETRDPELIHALEALMDPDGGADPTTPLRWTCQSTRMLSAALQHTGHRVSDFVVRRLLKQAGYTLRMKAKAVQGRQYGAWDAQFRYLNEQVEEHLAAGCPVVSVDATRKVPDGGDPHDGWSPSTGEAETAAPPHAWLDVDIDHDTTGLAVATIRRWWQRFGQLAHATSDRLLVTSTCLWNNELAALANHTGLTVTACLMPPGTWRWSRIGQRLAAQLTTHERGRPPTRHEAVVQTIPAAVRRAAKAAGRVRAPDDRGTAGPAGAATVIRHTFHGEWNYSLHPRTCFPGPDGRGPSWES